MQITVSEKKRFKIIKVTGSLDDSQSSAFKKTVNEAIYSGADNILLDLNAVSEIGRNSLGMILQFLKLVIEKSGTLYLLASPPIKQKYLSSNLEKIIRIFESNEEFEKEVINAAKQKLNILVRRHEKYFIIDILEELNVSSNLEDLAEVLDKLLQQNYKFIALNLSRIMHLYSQTIGLLIKRYKMIKALNGDLCIFGLNEEITGLLGNMHLDRLLALYPTESDFIKKIEKASQEEHK